MSCSSALLSNTIVYASYFAFFTYVDDDDDSALRDAELRDDRALYERFVFELPRSVDGSASCVALSKA